MTIPRELPEFLDWFREATERAWAELPEGALGFQRGTRWRAGLSDEGIAEIQRGWSLRFPPDHVLFLKKLHAVDRPMRVRKFEGQKPVIVDQSAFYDWTSDHDAIRAALEWPVEGVLFDVENNSLWLDEWGVRPDSEKKRAARVHEAARSAAPLIPIYGHRYLVGAPLAAGNPVLSVHQTDIIVYGSDLRAYLVNEHARLLGVKKDETHFPERAREIPFWGQFL